MLYQKNLLVAGGHTETLNGRRGKHKTTIKVAAACDMSTRRGATARQETPVPLGRGGCQSIGFEIRSAVTILNRTYP